MYKYKQTLDVEVGDLVMWTNPSSTNRIANKPYRVISTDNTLVGIKDENNTTSLYGSISRKTLFTKPADQAVVGDYMYRISSSTNAFPKHSVIKITRIGNERLNYSKKLGVDFHEVIVIAQAEPEVKYPLFMRWGYHKNTLVKFDGINSGTQLTTSKDYSPGEHSLTLIPHTNHNWKPCDFTIEPEIFDIDWWQQRFEAGLPVYISDEYGNSNKCNLMPSKTWSKHYTFSMTDPSLVQQVPTIPESAISFALYPSGAPSEPTQPTTKEQSMNKTTLKLLLELLGASEEVKDATNSKFVGIITNEDEYIGYMYFDSKEDAAECMAQPRMELHKLHLFEKSCVLAQNLEK